MKFAKTLVVAALVACAANAEGEGISEIFSVFTSGVFSYNDFYENLLLSL